MDYISAKEASVLWKITDQMIRRHCRNGRIPGSVQRNGTWYVPADAKKPTKLKPDIAPTPKLVKQLQRQRTKKIYHGLYDYIQINLRGFSACLHSKIPDTEVRQLLHRWLRGDA